MSTFRTFSLGCLVAIGATVALAAQTAPPVALAPPAVRAALDVAVATVQPLVMLPNGTDGGVVTTFVFAGVPLRIELEPFDVRSADYQCFTRTPDGLHLVPPPPCDTFRGQLAGEPGSAVAASFDGASLHAYVRRASGDVFVVQPVRDALPSVAGAAHAVFRAADARALERHCGVVAPAVVVPPPVVGFDMVSVCELALEADHPLFLANGGSVAATQNDVLAIVNAVDLIFRQDVQIQFQVRSLVVDSAPDSYTATTASALLAEFRTFWNGNYAGLARDTAHLFSGRPLGASGGGTIGFAYVGVLCNPSNAYGVSETTWTANFALRVGLTAHELGHNANAAHCDGQPTCNVMCSFIGGCSGNAGAFGPGEQAQIVAYQQTISCLTPQATPPQITGVTPVQIPTVQPPLVTVTGTGLFGTTAVTVGGQVVTQGIAVQGDTQLTFTPPAGLPLAFLPLTVTNPAGTSNAAVLWYRAADPCRVVVPPTAQEGTILEWSLGGLPGHDAFLLASTSTNLVPFLGESIFESFLLLWAGPLDARGMVVLATPVPTGVLLGVTVHWQMLDAIPGTVSLQSVSSLTSTLIF
ncbi:MAG: M12 family metallo-peptidase [Planctomycetota bacterium]